MKILLLATLLLSLSATSCGFSADRTTAPFSTSAPTASIPLSTSVVPDFSGFSHLGGYDEIFDRSTEPYIVYLYSLSCSNCNAVKREVIDFATAHADQELYFLDVATAGSSGREEYLAATGQTGVGVPCMILVSGGGTFDPAATGAHLARGSGAVLDMIAAVAADAVPQWE